MLWLISSVIFGLFSIFGALCVVGSFGMNDGSGTYLIFMLLTLLMVLICFACFMTYRNRKKLKLQRKDKMNELNAKDWAIFTHTVGLPLPEGVNCKLYLCEDKIVIEGNNVAFNLQKEKIIDVSIKTNTEIQKAYVSSAGGAVAGALLFGPLGALVGGRTKQRRSIKVTKYLIFTYEKEGNPDYMAFDIKQSFKAAKFVKHFQKNIEEHRKKVEL